MKNKTSTIAVRRLSVLLFFLLSFVALAGTVSARPHMFNREARQTHQEGTTLDGPVFFSGNNVRIDGDVTGMTFASGEHVEVNGDINGSLFVITGLGACFFSDANSKHRVRRTDSLKFNTLKKSGDPMLLDRHSSL